MNEEQGFIAAIQADPFDDTTKLVYADWLEERGDIRHHYLRVLVMQRQFAQGIARMREVIDPRWLGAINEYWRVVLLGFTRDREVQLLTYLSTVTGRSHAVLEELLSGPELIWEGRFVVQSAATFDAAENVWLYMSYFSRVVLERDV